jgi:transposase
MYIPTHILTLLSFKKNNLTGECLKILSEKSEKEMVRNKNLSKHILDCGWGMFKTMLEYK